MTSEIPAVPTGDVRVEADTITTNSALKIPLVI